LIDCSACGYFVDWLRSCYASRWNLPTAGEVDGRYFWSADGALPYPTWSYLGSRNWHQGDGSPWPEFGELENAKQSWRNGALGQILPNQVNVGDGVCIGSDLIGPIVSAPAGLAGGVDRRCYSVPMPVETSACTAFNPSALQYRFTFVGVQDLAFPCSDTSIFNATWTVANLAACTWRNDSTHICTGAESFRWHLMYNHPSFPGKWVLFAASTVVSFRWVRYELAGSAWLPLSANQMLKVDELDPALQFPETVTVFPVA